MHNLVAIFCFFEWNVYEILRFIRQLEFSLNFLLLFPSVLSVPVVNLCMDWSHVILFCFYLCWMTSQPIKDFKYSNQLKFKNLL